jgi:hypothetical protein
MKKNIFKRGSLLEKTIMFYHEICSDIDFKKALGLNFSINFKYLRFYSKKLIFVHFYNKRKLKSAAVKN